MTKYQVNVPEELAAFVERVLAEKKWDSVDDLISYALSQVESELKLEEKIDSDVLRTAVRVGIEQADRGELTDGPTVLKRLKEKLEAARKLPT
jgi:Arc/MetJ-type ribon-helix-helix transcriptional regulator